MSTIDPADILQISLFQFISLARLSLIRKGNLVIHIISALIFDTFFTVFTSLLGSSLEILGSLIISVSPNMTWSRNFPPDQSTPLEDSRDAQVGPEEHASR